MNEIFEPRLYVIGNLPEGPAQLSNGAVTVAIELFNLHRYTQWLQDALTVCCRLR